MFMGRSGNRGADVMSSRKARAGTRVGIMAIGLVAVAAFFAADLWFTAKPLTPYLGEASAWAAAFITTPLQIWGGFLLGSKRHRDELRKNDSLLFWATFFFLGIASLGDILSNIWGITQTGQTNGVEMTALAQVIIVFFGFVMAEIELVGMGFIDTLATNLGRLREAKEALEKMEKKSGRSALNQTHFEDPPVKPPSRRKKTEALREMLRGSSGR